jgi:UDP-N-acetylmuramate dehydrogenase
VSITSNLGAGANLLYTTKVIKQDIPLKDYSNFKTGGNAAYFLEVLTVEELISGLTEWKEKNLQNLPSPVVLSAGTNVLIDDGGYKGLVIHNKISGITLDDEIITIGSGVLTSDVIDFAIENSLSGLEWAGGLPGTIGGAVRGNAGAFGGETKDNVLSVESLNFDTLEKNEWTREQCKFGYRNSFFKMEEGRKELIIGVKLSLAKGDQEAIKKVVDERMEYRKNRHPLEYPNLGSTFKNVPYDSLPYNLKEEFKQSIKNDPFPIIPVVKILIGAGLKGHIIGGAQFSEKHPNFIVNLGNATSKDAQELLRMAREVVNKKYGINLEEEIIYLGGDNNGR